MQLAQSPYFPWQKSWYVPQICVDSGFESSRGIELKTSGLIGVYCSTWPRFLTSTSNNAMFTCCPSHSPPSIPHLTGGEGEGHQHQQWAGSLCHAQHLQRRDHLHWVAGSLWAEHRHLQHPGLRSLRPLIGQASERFPQGVHGRGGQYQNLQESLGEKGSHPV